jgi:hypothetical protein
MAVSGLALKDERHDRIERFKWERFQFTCLNTDVQVVITTKKGKIKDFMCTMAMTSFSISASGNQLTLNFVAGPTQGIVWLLVE